MKHLKLEVIFGAVNNLSPALRIIVNSSKAANDALKRTRDAIKQLNDQQKQIDGFKRLKQQTQDSGKALKDMQDHIKSLRQQMGNSPTAAMQRDFDKAVQSAKRLKDAHNRNQQALQQMRNEMNSAGINTNNLAQHQQQLRQRLASTTQEYERQRTALRNLGNLQQQHQRNTSTVRNMAMGGAVAAGTGVAALYQLKKPIHETKAFDVEQARVGSLGLGDKTTQDAIKYAKAMKTYGTSTLDNLTLVRDGITAFADLHHAEMVAPTLAKMKFANEAMYGNETGAENEKKFMDMLKVIELRGGLKSEADFKKQANIIQQVITATGGRVQGEEWLNVIKTGGIAAKNQNNEAFYYKMEALVQEMGGHRVGTSMMSAYQNLYQGRTTQRAARNLDKFGLIGDQSKVKHDKAGQLSYLDIGAIKNADLFRDDQFAWMEEVLVPAIKAKGITKDKDIVDAIGSIFSNRTASNLFSQMYSQREQIHKNARLNAGADDIEKLEAKAKNTTAGKELEARARLHNAYLVFGQTILPIYTKAVEMAASALSSFTNWMQRNPRLAKMLGAGLLTIAVGLVAIGGALIIFSPLILGMLSLRLAMATLGTQGGLMARVFGLFPNIFGGFSRALGTIRLFGVANSLKFIGHNLLLLSRLFMTTPIGLAITAIAAGALLIYKYWQPIKAFMSGMWTGFLDGINASKSMLADFINSIQPLKPIWSWMVDKFTTFKGVLAEIVSPFQATNQQLNNANKYGQTFGTWLGILASGLIAYKGIMMGVALAKMTHLGGAFKFVGSFALWLGRIMGGALLTSVRMLGSALFFMGRMAMIAGRFMMANPIIAIIAAIAFAAYQIYTHWDKLAPYFQKVWDWVKNTFSAGVQLVKNLLLNFTPLGLIYSNWDGISSWFSNKWQSTKQAFSNGVETSKSFLATWTPGIIYNNWDGISSWFSSKFAELKTGFSGGIGGISRLILDWSPIGLFYQVWAKVLSWFGIDLPAKFSGFGGMIIDGLKQGINNKIDGLKATFTNMANSLPDWVKRALDIHSPSRVFAGIGHFIMQGLAKGLDNNSPLQTLKKKTKQLVAAGLISLPLTFANAKMPDQTQAINQVVNPAAMATVPDQKQGIFQRLIAAIIPPVKNQVQTINQVVNPANAPAMPAQWQTVYRQLVSGVIPPVPDQTQAINQVVNPAAMATVPDQYQGIFQRLVAAIIPPVKNQVQTINQVVNPANAPAMPAQWQTVYRQLVSGVIPPVPDQTQAINQVVNPAAMATVPDQKQGIFQRFIAAIIPPVKNQVQTINQVVNPANAPAMPAQWQTVYRQLVSGVIPPVPDQTQAINQVVNPAAMATVPDQKQGIFQRFIAAIIPPVKDQVQNIRQTLQPAFLSLPKVFDSILKLTLDKTGLDIPKLFLGSLGYDTSIIERGSIAAQTPEVKPLLEKFQPTKTAAPVASKNSHVVVEGDKIEIHVHQQPGQSNQQLVQLIRKELEQHQHNKQARIRASLKDQD